MKQFIFLVLLTTLILAANISAQEQRAGKFGIGYSGNFTSETNVITCLLYTSPSPRDRTSSRMPSSA